jgi:hypothetical protein
VTRSGALVFQGLSCEQYTPQCTILHHEGGSVWNSIAIAIPPACKVFPASSRLFSAADLLVPNWRFQFSKLRLVLPFLP